MKKLLLPILFVAAPFFLNAQTTAACSAQISFTPASCYGTCDGAATATPSGGVPPYTYLWGPNGQTTQAVTGLCAGNYSCNVIDANNCSNTQYFNITQPGQITLNYSQVPATCSNCQNGSATAIVSGGASPYTYNWFPSGGTSVTETGLNPGTYSFTVTDANGCTVGMLFTVQNSVGIADQAAAGDLSVYPSPAEQAVTVDQAFTNPVSAEISITNLPGEIVFVKQTGEASQLHETIAIAELPNGIYFITVKTGSGISTRKFVKQ